MISRPTQDKIKTNYVNSPTQRPQIVNLRRLNARDLEPLLLEETAEWASQLDWDFSKSANLVRKMADAQRLSGVALLDDGQVAGYGYGGIENHKGLIADVYVRSRWRNRDTEAAMFHVLQDALTGVPGVCRIEGQLMLMETASVKTFRPDRVRLFERLLMGLAADRPLPPGKTSTKQRFRIEQWTDGSSEAAAAVLSLAHIGHIDAQMNDEYRTFAKAHRLLHNVVQFPGSATFFPEGSYVAFDDTSGTPAGVVLSSFIAGDVAHITEICVTPNARGAGLGYELLRQSAAALHGAGAKRISLTVTAANQEAIRLYTRCGFREMRRFHAYLWEGSPETN